MYTKPYIDKKYDNMTYFLSKTLFIHTIWNINKRITMIYTQDKELLSYAIRMGCKTAAEFALFLKVRESILAL